MKKFITLILLVVSFQCSAVVQTPATKIEWLSIYTNYGEADMLINVKDTIAECDGGFWFNKLDKGYESNLSFLLSAFHAKSNIVVTGIETELWAGSTSNKYCKVRGIQLK